ncbi:MAG: thymidine kinase [Hydrogenibacillus sp.]|nr:thymidine kinase [Hydrogenibacillus sp.]
MIASSLRPSGEPGRDFGWLTVITGAMFSGKTSRLVALAKAVYDRLAADGGNGSPYVETQVFIAKHALDTRYGMSGAVVSHDGQSVPAALVSTVKALGDFVRARDARVILLDEAQFFKERDEFGDYALVRAVERWVEERRWVVVAGLDRDFRGRVFGPMGALLALADEKVQMLARCAVCGAPATLTQRLVEGLPAEADDPEILVGAEETYEPRCRRCHVVQPAQEGTPSM